MVSIEDADFAFGINSHEGTIWILPAQCFEVLGLYIRYFLVIFLRKIGGVRWFAKN